MNRGDIGACLIEPSGKRQRKSGNRQYLRVGIRTGGGLHTPIGSFLKLAKTPADAKKVAGEILGMTIKGYTVREVWCETAQPWIEIDLTREHADRNPPLAA